MSNPEITAILRFKILFLCIQVLHVNSTTQIQKEQNMTLTTNLQTAFEIRLHNKKEQSRKASFEESFLEAADSAFSLLGDSGKQTIYLHLEKSYGLTRKAIPYEVVAFASALKAIFGEASVLIEMRIMRSLFQKARGFKVYSGKTELSFKDYVECLRRFV